MKKWYLLNRLHLSPSLLILAGILTLGFALMAYRIGDPFDGFHGFNEAFYTLLSKKYMEMPFYQILISPLDFNNPPLFPALLALFFKLFGVSEAVARSVPVLFSLLSILFVYRIGKLVYNERVGLVAAALLAVSPGFVLVGRNVQTDAIFVFFMLASLYYYIDSAKNDSLRGSVAGGVFLGLGLISKIPALLLPAAIVIWHLQRKRDFSWIDKRFILYSLSAFLVGVPWYLYQIIANKSAFLGSQSHLAATFNMPNLPSLWEFFVVETYWALSPLVSLLVIASLVFAMVKGGQKGRLILLVMAAFVLFYFFYHYHSYYILPLIPLSLLLVGVMLDKHLESTKLLVGVTLAIMFVSTFFAIAMLSSHKYGHNVYSQVASVVNSAKQSDIVIEVSDEVKGSYGPILEYYMPGVTIKADKQEDFPEDKQVFWLLQPRAVANDYINKEGVYVCESSWVDPVIFGHTVIVGEREPNPHIFNMGGLELERSTNIMFGLSESRLSEYLLVDWTKLGTPSSNEVIR